MNRRFSTVAFECRGRNSGTPPGRSGPSVPIERWTTTDTTMTTSASGPRRPPAPDCNLLWASSRGVCAAPDCERPLLVFDGGRWTTLGEIAHIRAHSPEGPRFDATWTGSVDSYDNCLLLCRDHHRLIDSNADAYPVDSLLDWKRQHELPRSRAPARRNEPHRRASAAGATRHHSGGTVQSARGDARHAIPHRPARPVRLR